MQESGHAVAVDAATGQETVVVAAAEGQQPLRCPGGREPPESVPAGNDFSVPAVHDQ